MPIDDRSDTRYTSPHTPQTRRGMQMQTELHLLTKAYYDGRDAFRAGAAEPPKGQTDLEKEFRRGYMMTRKHARFDATIKARAVIANARG